MNTTDLLTKPEARNRYHMKADILIKLEELLGAENILTVQKEFNQLSNQFKSLTQKPESAASTDEKVPEAEEPKTDIPTDASPDELPTDEVVAESTDEVTPEEKVDEKTEEAEKPVEVAVDEYSEKFAQISSTFKEKIKAAIEEGKKLEAETIKQAKELLAELREVVENEENIGKAFSGFNAIKDKWQELPKVSNDMYRDLNAEYNKVVEKFFYNINIYKELKDLDLKHNLEEKKAVLEDQKKLLELNDIRMLEVEVRMNQDRWNEIGPTYKEEWDKIKDEFWTVTREIYKRVQEFYNLRRGEQEKNLELKKELLNKVKYIESLELKAHKKWQEKTKEIIDIQKEWKMIGLVPKEEASAIWKEFRETCDRFFENKRAHYEEVHKIQDANKEAKQLLVDKAESVKDSEDWNATANILVGLQKEWKKIGPAHQRDENKLWRKFRGACDHFFQARKSHQQSESASEVENLELKKNLIQELESFTPGDDRKSNLDTLKDFSEKWRNIGHVPFKDKDAINKAYKKALDDKYSALKIDKKQKDQIRFEQKLEDIKGSDRSDMLIRKEHDYLRNQISKLEAEIIQLETNMGFFASSAGADKFKEEIERKIEKARAEISELRDKMSVLRKM